MKTYVLTVSKTFPITHKKKGEPTFFIEKINEGQNKINECKDCSIPCKKTSNCMVASMCFNPKLHTIRSNYPLWAKHIKEIQEGKAILSVRYWSGKPYNSKQIEFLRLGSENVGIQELHFDNSIDFPYIVSNQIRHENFWSISELAKNDGLSLADFKEWFKKYDLSKPMAIIHFTKFRY